MTRGGSCLKFNMGIDKLAKNMASIYVQILKSSYYDKNLVILCFDKLL